MHAAFKPASWRKEELRSGEGGDARGVFGLEAGIIREYELDEMMWLGDTSEV